MQNSLNDASIAAPVQELGRQVFKFDLDPSDLDSYRGLWASLAPADQRDVDAALLLG